MDRLSKERAFQIAKTYIDRNHDEMPALIEQRKMAITKENDYIKNSLLNRIDGMYNLTIKPTVEFLTNILMRASTKNDVNIEQLTDDRYLEQVTLDTIAAAFNERSTKTIDVGLTSCVAHIPFFDKNVIKRAIELRRPEYMKQLNDRLDKEFEARRKRQEEQAAKDRREWERDEKIRELEAEVNRLKYQKHSGGGNPPPPPVANGYGHK